MSSLVLGDLTKESLTPSVNECTLKKNDENMYNNMDTKCVWECQGEEKKTWQRADQGKTIAAVLLY